MIKISLQQFVNYLKLFATPVDKEEIARIYAKKELYDTSDEQINEIFIEALDTVDMEFIKEYELFFIIFDVKPAFQENMMIGEINSHWSLTKKKDFFEYLDRTLN